MVTAVVLLALLAPVTASAKSALSRQGAASGPARNAVSAPLHVPLPQPRPAGAPARDAVEGSTDADKAADKEAEPDKPAAPPAKSEAVAPVSACRLALTDDIAVAPSIPAIHGPGGCGGDDLIRLEAVVLPDKRKVPLTPAAIMRCPMASAVVNWVRSDIVPLEQSFGSPLAALDNFDSYECRGRNRVVGAQLSEHGRANALDVRGFKLADGRMIGLTDRTEPRELRETVLHSVCTRFSTVLGPDSDWYHEDHIHLDLAERRNNYRICQWDVLDPMPKVAPLLPAVRPDEAPSRETADAGEKGKSPRDVKGQATEPAAAAVQEDERSRASPAGKDEPDQAPQATAPVNTVPAGPPSRTNATRGRKSREVPAAVSAPTQAADKPSSKLDTAQPAPANKRLTGTTAAETKPATKKRNRIHRGWNPFGPFF